MSYRAAQAASCVSQGSAATAIGLPCPAAFNSPVLVERCCTCAGSVQPGDTCTQEAEADEESLGELPDVTMHPSLQLHSLASWMSPGMDEGKMPHKSILTLHKIFCHIAHSH